MTVLANLESEEMSSLQLPCGEYVFEVFSVLSCLMYESLPVKGGWQRLKVSDKLVTVSQWEYPLYTMSSDMFVSF